MIVQLSCSNCLLIETKINACFRTSFDVVQHDRHSIRQEDDILFISLKGQTQMNFVNNSRTGLLKGSFAINDTLNISTRASVTFENLS